MFRNSYNKFPTPWNLEDSDKMLELYKKQDDI